MRKPVFFCLFMLSLLAVSTAARVSAQPEAPDEEVDFITDEALDLIEERIDRTGPLAGEALPGNATLVAGDHSTAQENTSDALPLELTTTTPQGIEVTGEIVAVPDEDMAEDLETKIIPLAYAEASGVIAALEGMKSPRGEVAYDAAVGAVVLKDTAENIAAMSAYVKKVDVLLETEIFQPQYVKIADIIDRVRRELTEGVGEAEPDELAGSMIVTDTPEAIGKIRAVVKEMDRLNKAARIQTKILQIVLNEEHMRGVDWEAIVSDYQSVNVPGFSNEAGTADNGSLSLGVVTKEDYAVLLDALDTVGAITTVGEEVATVDYNQPKAVKVLPVDQSGEGDVPAGAAQVNLDVIPSLNKDGAQTISIQPRLGEGNPGRSLDERKAGAEVRINNEDTIVVGGLFKEVMVESTWKIPLLGDLPLLGFVFRNEGEVPRRAEVITFLTVNMVEKD